MQGIGRTQPLWGIYVYVTFDQRGNLIINPSMKENQINFVSHITDVMKIKDEHITKKMLNYLMIHNKRVNFGL